MRIAIVNQPLDGILPPDQNSIGIWSYEVARRLAAGNEVSVHGKWMRYFRPKRIGRHLEREGVSYRFHPCLPNRLWPGLASKVERFTGRGPLYSSMWYGSDYALSVALALRRERPDVIHVHNFTPFVPIIRALNRRTPIVLHMSCEWLSQLDLRRMDERIRQVDLVVGTSDHITDRVRDRFPHHAHKCRTISNGVGLDAFASTPTASGVDRSSGQDPVLLFVGRVSPEKGVHDLVDAFAMVAEHHPDVRLELVGPVGALPRDFIIDVSDDEEVAALSRFYPGDYLDHLRSRTSDEVWSRITFRGGIPHRDVPEAIDGATLLVNPSYVESFGMALIEAMAAEVAVVATRTGGMVEVVDEGVTGLLVDRGDVPGLAKAIDQLLANPERRRAMGVAGRARATERYSWEAVSAAARRAYDDLVRSAP